MNASIAHPAAIYIQESIWTIQSWLESTRKFSPSRENPWWVVFSACVRKLSKSLYFQHETCCSKHNKVNLLLQLCDCPSHANSVLEKNSLWTDSWVNFTTFLLNSLHSYNHNCSNKNPQMSRLALCNREIHLKCALGAAKMEDFQISGHMFKGYACMFYRVLYTGLVHYSSWPFNYMHDFVFTTYIATWRCSCK